MREVDDAAEREDQRQAERNQQVVDADEQAVEHLLDDEDELHGHCAATAAVARSPLPPRAKRVVGRGRGWGAKVSAITLSSPTWLTPSAFATLPAASRGRDKKHHAMLHAPFGGAMLSRSSPDPGTVPSAS